MSSKFISKQRLAFLSAAGMSLMGASMAFGVGGTISITSSPTLNLGASGLTQGLIGTVWHLPPDGAGSGNYGLPAAGDPTLTDLTNMESYISTGAYTNKTLGTTNTLPPASETFLNTADKFAYNSTGGSIFWAGFNTAGYLGADAAGATLTDPAPWVNSIVDQMGYIKIASAGTYNFAFTHADDAATVFIGGTGITPTGNAGSGTQIVAASYDNSKIGTADYTATVSFSSAGYYPIEIMNYQEGGGAGMNFSVTAPTGGTTPTYWTTNALASSVTPAASAPTPSPAPTPTDEWNFARSAISGTSVSDIGTAGTAATAGTIVGSNTSVVGTQLVTTTTSPGNGMTVPGATFTNYTGDFSVAVTFTRNANDPTGSWDSVFSFGTQGNSSAGFLLFQPHRNDGSGVAAVAFQPNGGAGASGLINGNGQPVPTGVLTQEVLVYSAATNTASLYENGVLQESGLVILPSGVTSFNLSTYAKYVGIGGVDPFNDPSLMGSYNDFSTWNSALTAGQVSGLYSTAVPEPAAVVLFGLGAAGMLLVKRRRTAVTA